LARSTAAVLAQIDAALAFFEQGRSTSQYDDLSDLDGALASEMITRLSATVDRLAPPNSQYRDAVNNALKTYGPGNTYAILILAGALKALRADYAAGHLQRIEELIQSDLFANFLEMAEHLLSQGYKDPAAVLAGGVLEEHLRKLCIRSGIPTTHGGKPKKADTMNAELTAAGIYNKLDQKSVTAWLDLRNKAAHGHYTEYGAEQVRVLLQGVRDFAARYL